VRDRAAAIGGGEPLDQVSGRPQVDQARMVDRRLAAAKKPVSRRALRRGGVKGSNEALNALARMINSEIAGTAPPRAPTG
jgi:hypothetical protein